MFLTGYGVKSCIFQTPPDDNVPVLSPENAAAADAASRTCDAMHSTGMARSCRLDIAMTNIVVAINTSQSEAVKMCRNSVEQIHGVTDDFAGTGWDLMIVSPLTGDTLAICGLGF